MLVGCRRQGQSLQIGVYDTVFGIPLLKRGEIFKEFHRLEQGARIARGLGLGLSIVERLARVLNHGIAIDANASGGSLFSVTVPAAEAINHTAAVTSATPLSRMPITGALIVCIENDPAILDGMKTLLNAWNAEVIAVTDPDAAIAAIEASGGSVTGLLVDYHLDRGNGVAAIRESAAASAKTSGHPDHGGSQPERPGGRARGEHRDPQQAGETGLAPRPAGAVAHPADGGGGGVKRRHCEGATAGARNDGGTTRRRALAPLPPAILAAAITAWVRLSTPSFCRIAETCALMVASDTPSS